MLALCSVASLQHLNINIRHPITQTNTLDSQYQAVQGRAPTRTPLPTSNTLRCLLPNHPWPAHPRASQPCHTSPMPEVSNCPWHASMQSMKEETAAPSILSATLLTASLSFIRELRKPCKCWLDPFSLPRDSNGPVGTASGDRNSVPGTAT